MTQASEDEVVLKLLHTADWHLGRRFERFGERGRELSRERLNVIDRILFNAERHAVHAVLCAGDLFDDASPSQDWWEPLTKLFHKHTWRDRPVFLLPGNHDPLTEGSIWTRSQFRRALPEFVHVVDHLDFSFELHGGAVLYAVPCMSSAGQNDPTESIPKRQLGDERIRIGLVHGSTFDAADCQTNFPIAKDAVIQRGLDYLAIGDTHGFRFIPPERRIPPTIYPGAPEATAFDEKDPGCVAVVLMSRQRRATVNKERVARWTWEEAVVRDLDELRQLTRRPDLASRVLRLTLDMRVPAPEYTEVESLLRELEGNDATHGKVGVLVLDRDKFMLDVQSITDFCHDLPAVLQATAQRLKQAAENGPDSAVAERALYHLYRLSRKAS
jgi:DNA repair exonuclease SbcCD nuclease subunit